MVLFFEIFQKLKEIFQNLQKISMKIIKLYQFEKKKIFEKLKIPKIQTLKEQNWNFVDVFQNISEIKM